MKTIKSKIDFNKVYMCGKQLRGKYVRVVYTNGTLPYARVAFAAGKRIGTAPVRNRCKRLLRAAVRDTLPTTFSAGYNFLFFATSATQYAHPASIAKELTRLIGTIRDTKPPL